MGLLSMLVHCDAAFVELVYSDASERFFFQNFRIQNASFRNTPLRIVSRQYFSLPVPFERQTITAPSGTSCSRTGVGGGGEGGKDCLARRTSWRQKQTISSSLQTRTSSTHRVSGKHLLCNRFPLKLILFFSPLSILRQGFLLFLYYCYFSNF